MSIDDDEKSDKKYDPTKIEKVEPMYRDVSSGDESEEPKTKLGKLLRGVKQMPVVQRRAKEQERRLIQAETQRVNTETELIDARTKQNEALGRNAQSQIDGVKYSPEARAAEIAANEEISKIERQQRVEEAAHQNKLRKKQRKRELKGTKEPEQPKSPELTYAQKVKAKMEDAMASGFAGEHVKAMREIKEEEITKYGGWDNVPDDKKRDIRNGMAQAHELDKSES